MKAGRYEIGTVLGEGGMGIVYRAFDPVLNRDVTIKTIRDPQDKAVLDLFRRECAVLSSMPHPNIVDILDIGEMEDGGVRRPYFVMPFLKGVTLQDLIRNSSPRLTVERSIQMIAQGCRGLQAAHEQGLIHRDIKPSNMFVLDDDSIKIIDFGVAHLSNQRSTSGLKGTMLYMSPEQLRRKQPTPQVDQFCLAVVCYEMLARRHPFVGVGGSLAEAILSHKPAPVSEFNPTVSPSVSQVIHKALAKEPFNRFDTMRQFSDALQKALRGETIEVFDLGRIAARMQRARTAFQAGDVDDAAEILSELEAEDLLVPEIGDLRKDVDEALRSRTVTQLLETARKRLADEEYVGALRKVQEVLNLDPSNNEAFTLKGAIETRRSSTQVEDWFRLANEHMENHAYSHAREALEKVIETRPKEVRAQELLSEVGRREQDYLRKRAEKQVAYESALQAFQRGDINSAVNRMERVLDIDRRTAYSTMSQHEGEYQKFYKEVVSKRDELSSQEAEARSLLRQGEFAAAMKICDSVLAAYPNQLVFGVLRDDIQQAEQQEISSYLAKAEREVAAELDLNRKVAILEEAQRKYPSEQRFEQALQRARSRRDLVDSIVGKARTLEDSRQFSEALAQWEILRNIYPQYPGLDIEIERVEKRRGEQSRTDSKTTWATQIDQAIAIRNYTKATALLTEALAEFPGDPELTGLAKQVEAAEKQVAESQEKVRIGRGQCEAGSFDQGLATLREAYAVQPHHPAVRTGMMDGLLHVARARFDADWRDADKYIQEALEIDPNHPLARSLSTLVKDKRQSEDVTDAISKARELQSQNKLADAIAELDTVLSKYPLESRVLPLRGTLVSALQSQDPQKSQQLSQVPLDVTKNVGPITDPGLDQSFFEKSIVMPGPSSAKEAVPPAPPAKAEPAKKEASTPIAPPAPKETPKETKKEAAKKDEPKKKEEPKKKVDPAPANVAAAPASKKPTWMIAAAAVVVLAIGGFFLMNRNSGEPEPAPAATLVKLSVPNANAGEFTLMDSNGQDVTAKIAGGLPPGTYVLKANRSGFQAVDETFTLEAARGADQSHEIAWQPLATAMVLQFEKLSGDVQFDGVAEVIDPATPRLQKTLTEGMHTLNWSTPAGDSVAVNFTIDKGAAQLSEPVVKGQVVGLVAAVSGDTVTYFGVKAPKGIVKIVDGVNEDLAPAGTFPAAASLVSFALKPNSYPLGSLPIDPAGPATVWVYLAPQAPARPSGKAAPKQPATQVAPAPAAPQPPVSAAPPPPPPKPTGMSESERRTQEILNRLKGNK